MFGGKKHSWYWLTFWALVFAGFVFMVARFFLHLVNTELLNSRNGRKYRTRELFI